MLNWRVLLANFVTDRHLTYLCNTFTLYLHMKTTGVDMEAQRVVGMGNQWPQTFIMRKKMHQGVVVLLPRVRSMSRRVKRVHLWRMRMSYWSVTFIYCNEPFMWVSVLLKGLAKSKAVGDANTTYLFYSQVWNIKWSFNDSCVHLSRNLTALKIQGRGWNTDKWRAGWI